MGDIGLLKQAWKWPQSHKQAIMGAQTAAKRIGDWLAYLIDNNGQSLYNLVLKLGTLLKQWRDSFWRGSHSLFGSGMTSLFIILWSCFLSLATSSCLIYVLLILGAASATIHYLGYTPGLFIAGLFGILSIWMYGSLWIMGMLFMVGGYMFSQNHARPLIFISTTYSIYYVYTCAGWFGIFLSTNLSFLSNDLLMSFLQGYDCLREHEQCEEPTKTEPIADEFVDDSEFDSQTVEEEDVVLPKSCKISSMENLKMEIDPSPSKIMKSDSCSLDEMKRIMSSLNHYEALGFPRNNLIDSTMLKKEYKRKAVLVHPDKNMGNPLASESFKKLQSAYEVLSDDTKRREYDNQLRKEESRIVSKMYPSSTQQAGVEYRSEESRRVDCTKCGCSHLWICTTRSKAMARWCMDCRQYHQAKDGEGWVEQGFSTVISSSKKVEIPRAFVCAESKIFDVSEWAICQGVVCGANTHRPSFRVSMVGLDKRIQRSNSAPFPFGLDAEMMSEDEDDFELWFQQALASGMFSETSQRRKSWSPFKISQKNIIMKQLRRFS